MDFRSAHRIELTSFVYTGKIDFGDVMDDRKSRSRDWLPG